jgi:predicted oxidoreductase
VENSLERLGLETIDLLLIHRPDPLMDAIATGQILDTLIASGKIRAAGVSNFASHDIDLLQSKMKNTLVTNQVEMSVLSTTALTDGTLAYAGAKNMPLMAWSPLGGGRLWGDTPQAIRVKRVLDPIAKRYHVDIDAVAIAWLLMHPTPIIPIIGTTDLGRIAQL